MTDLVQRLREYFNYDKTTGVVYWKKNKGARAKAGNPAGAKNDGGYVVVKFDGKSIGAHRIAWAIEYGYWPSKEIDHINGIASDNRLSNLREVTHQQNCLNSKVSSRSKVGVKGVSRHNSGGYQANIVESGAFKYLGYFKTIAEAKAAYDNAAERIHGEYRLQR
jgi:HNH endonuclease/AP2 domain